MKIHRLRHKASLPNDAISHQQHNIDIKHRFKICAVNVLNKEIQRLVNTVLKNSSMSSEGFFLKN